MIFLKRASAVSAAILFLGAGSARAAEIWNCEYSGFRDAGRDEGSFHVQGDELIENSGDVILTYKLLENSDAAVVAAKGGSYASDPHLMGFLVMINKGTGEFLLATASNGAVSGKQTGICKLAPSRSGN